MLIYIFSGSVLDEHEFHGDTMIPLCSGSESKLLNNLEEHSKVSRGIFNFTWATKPVPPVLQ